MFDNINWQSYWTAIAIFCASYYLIVYQLFFRRNATFYLKRLLGVSISHEKDLSSLYPNFLNEEENNLKPMFYACMDEIEAFFEQTKKFKPVKKDIVSSLQTILKKYPSLKASAYNDSLLNLIITQCENFCSIHLGENDLVVLWLQ